MENELANRVGAVPERFVPDEMHGEATEAEHLARYWWAAQLAPGRRVLDAGCGVGYGTAILAEHGPASVHGVDIAEPAVDAAAGAVGDAASFSVADVGDLPFDDGAFDLVVCFEVIEHVDDAPGVLAELARVLAEDGVLLVSSPNRDVYVPGNPHHVHEFTPDELRAALEPLLGHVELRRQHQWITSAILRDDELAAEGLHPIDGRVGKAIGLRPGRETYTLAVASRRPLPDVQTIAVMTGDVELRKWLDLWDEQQQVLARQHEVLQAWQRDEDELERTRAMLRDAEAELQRVVDVAHLRQEVDKERERAERAQHDIDFLLKRERQLMQDVTDLQGMLEEERRARHVLATSTSWRITAPLRRAARLIRSS